MCFHEESLKKLLNNAGIEKKSAYTTGNVSRLLGVSMTTVIRLCDEWQPPIKDQHNKGLECYQAGTHRRIPHHALIEWLQTNLYYNSLGVDNE